MKRYNFDKVATKKKIDNVQGKRSTLKKYGFLTALILKTILVIKIVEKYQV